MSRLRRELRGWAIALAVSLAVIAIWLIASLLLDPGGGAVFVR
jgi:hypothetical protein